MKHWKTIIFFFTVSLLIVGITVSPVLYSVIVIRPRIYYKIEYNVNLSNREEIIYKVENLNYIAYLHNFDYDYQSSGISSYVDRNLIHFLKSRIENDGGFTLWPYYRHYLHYIFLGKNHSKLYLIYNNNTIFSLKDKNNQSLLLKGDKYWEGFTWYLNFTQIPYVYGDISTMVLSELIFVEINVEYEWNCGYVCFHEYLYKQYLLLSKNLDVILILIYHYIFID
ncbi:MAG: hypothetical protein ACFFCL_10080 [Promethearchaeota archaeon]